MNTMTVGRSPGRSAPTAAPCNRTLHTGRPCSVVFEASILVISNVACERAISIARSRDTSVAAVGHVAAKPAAQRNATAIIACQRDISVGVNPGCGSRGPAQCILVGPDDVRINALTIPKVEYEQLRPPAVGAEI